MRQGPGPQELNNSVGQVPMERLWTIFDGMFDGVWLVGADSRTTYANGAMARLVQSTPAGMRGRPVSEFVDPSAWPDVRAFLDRQRDQAGERMELRFRRADGGEAFGVVAGSPITTSEGVFVGTMLNVSDVSGKVKLDEQVIQGQRLEAVGQFAGGVAHDFNNLLMSIQGYTDMVRSRLPLGDPNRADLDQVLMSAERASALTRKLLAFTRQQVLTPVDVDPAQVITDLLPILRPLLGEEIDVVLRVEPSHSRVRVDPAQLEQVVVNLAINARDAMPMGGTLTIAIHDMEPVDPERPDPDLSAPNLVRISVADTGTGMDEATKGRIFDPFFTTKEPGRGTGLGLSTAFGIVAQSGGQISVESKVGQGSTFHVDLPRVGPLGLPPLSAAAADASPSVILLVDDEPAVREVVRRHLERFGYKVLAASGGEEALRMSEDSPDAIGVIVTDIIMPGTHGPELAAQIRAKRPNIGVVFMSGYAEEAVSERGEIAIQGEFLAKPFTVEALVGAIGRAVERQSGSE